MANVGQVRGFPIFGLLIGAAAGYAAYAVVEHWFDPAAQRAGPPAALVGIGAGGGATIDQVAGPIGAALIMTALGLLVYYGYSRGKSHLGRGIVVVIDDVAGEETMVPIHPSEQ